MINMYRFFYDLEVLPYNFTNAFVNEEHKVIVVMLHSNSNYKAYYNYDEIQKALQESYPDYTVRPVMDLHDTKTREYFNREFLGTSKKSEWFGWNSRSEEHTSELQSRFDLVCRLLLEKKN